MDPSDLLHTLLTRSYEIEVSEEEESYDGLVTHEGEDGEQYLVDEEDRDILMHRDAHFGGSFELMLESYSDERKSAVLDTTTRRIEALYDQEKALLQNIAAILLSGRDAEKVAASVRMYRDLRDLFDADDETVEQAVAALILSEEEVPEEEINALLSYGSAAIEPLLELMNSELFKDPLFPGYGKACLYAAECLGKLKAEAAVSKLCQLMHEMADAEEAAIGALLEIGKPAKEKLMEMAHRSIEEALVALLSFADSDVALFCLEELKSKKNSPLGPLLALGCETLPQEKIEELVAIAEAPDTHSDTKQEILFIANSLKKRYTPKQS